MAAENDRTPNMNVRHSFKGQGAGIPNAWILESETRNHRRFKRRLMMHSAVVWSRDALKWPPLIKRQ